MSTGTGLIRQQDRQMSLAELKEYGGIMAKSGVFKDVGSAERAIVKIEIGRSLGVDAATALRGIHVFDGKIELGSGIISLLIKRSGKYDYHIMQHNDEGCAIKFMEVMEDGTQKPIGWQLGDERPKDSGVSRWTKADTKRAGLDKKDVHTKYGAAMNFSRALTQGARWFCPDVFGGSVYATGEISGEMPEDAGPAVIEVSSTPATTETVAAPQEDDALDVPFEPAQETPVSSGTAPAPTPEPAPAPKPETPTPAAESKTPKTLKECSTEELIERCKSGFAELKLTKEQAKRVLARKGASKLSDLNEDQLRELAGNLFDKLTKMHMESALA